MMSRHEKPWPKAENTGAVSAMIQLNTSRSAMRKISASASPILRARSASALGSLETRTEMKMTLSTPSTTSITVSVAKATHTLGSSNKSSILNSGG